MDRTEIESKIKSGVPLTTTDQNGRSFADRILSVALDLGEHLLHCGGEINRVENTIERICRAYGAKHVEVFTITSVIVAEVRMSDGSYSSQIRRVLQSEMGTDLSTLERLNAISRRICEEKLDPEKAKELIKDAKKGYPFPILSSIIGAVLAAGAFAVFFGGNIADGIIAAIIGAAMNVFDSKKPPFINKMASTVISSFLGGILSCLMVHLVGIAGISCNVDKVIIGTIMLLVPGTLFGYALRDLMFGDTLSGTLKIIQSVLVASMIALGYSLAILIAGGIGI